MSEAQLAERVVNWLHDYGWEVYQEVPGAGGIIDIVAVHGPVRWIIETKIGMSLQLLNQLDRRIGHAHMVSAAIPVRVRKDVPHRLFKALGVGLLVSYGNNVIEERIHPRFLRRVAGDIGLHEQQKTFKPAGVPGGGHWTPFKETARNVVGHINWKPGCTLTELVAGITHHYSTPEAAKRNIVTWIDAGVIKGVKIDRTGKQLKFYPMTEEERLERIKEHDLYPLSPEVEAR